MYRAGDEIEYRDWLAELNGVADRLELGSAARSTAQDLFLSRVPEEDRSKQAALAASIYAGSLIAGEGRSQTAVAEAANVSRLSIQTRWKELLADAGFDPPSW